MQYENNSTGDSVENIQSLTTRIAELTQSVDFWNTGMLVTLVLAFVVAGAVALTTRMSIVRAKALEEVQSEIIKAKDRQLAIDLRKKDGEIAEAKKDAAEANRTAEKERLARIKIEEKLAPRTLSDNQRQDVIQKISKYKNILVDILQLGDGAEQQHMRQLLSIVVRQAKWKTHEWSAPGTDPIIGIAIGVSDTATELEKSAAHDLLAALKDTRLFIDSTPPFKAGAHTPEWPGFVMGEKDIQAGIAPIRIYIGLKP